MNSVLSCLASPFEVFILCACVFNRIHRQLRIEDVYNSSDPGTSCSRTTSSPGNLGEDPGLRNKSKVSHHASTSIPSPPPPCTSMASVEALWTKCKVCMYVVYCKAGFIVNLHVCQRSNHCYGFSIPYQRKCTKRYCSRAKAFRYIQHTVNLRFSIWGVSFLHEHYTCTRGVDKSWGLGCF